MNRRAVPEPPSFLDIGCLSQVFRNESAACDVSLSQLVPPTQKEIKRKKRPLQTFHDVPNTPVGDTAEDLAFPMPPSNFAQTQMQLDEPDVLNKTKDTQVTKSSIFTKPKEGSWKQSQTSTIKPARCTKPLFRPPVRYSQQQVDKSPEVAIETVPSPPSTPTYGSSQLSRFNSQEDLFESQPQLAGTPAKFTRDSIYTPQPLALPGVTPGGSQVKINNLRSVEEIPVAFRSVFSFPYFNIVQSKVFDDVFYRDKSLVVCAPTGSGKTVIFELAIIRILIRMQAEGLLSNFKAVYMAPMKALCSERCEDWKNKFQPLGLKCLELTGDTAIDDWFQLQEVNIIMTTPEKWDSMTRKWRDNKSLVQHIKLFLVDEIHMLHDDTRGATMEAVVSRMKTVQATFSRNSSSLLQMRFVAVSATVPNVEDIAEWLGSKEVPAEYYRMDDTYRPVKLRKVVLGYPCSENQTDFKFDLSLNYKLATVIQTYSDQKPTLVFCATRKGVQQAAATLVKDARFIMNAAHKEKLVKYSGRMRDSKLRDLVLFGVGYHHAGLDIADRKLVEEIFLNGELPVLLSTSTLAMGVNLPAHLVIVKSTQHYVMGMYQEYSETQILQMIGRAGRPQFDTSATAVIMTRNVTKSKYGNLLNGEQVIESSLHKHLIEHVNAEVVLNTITDVSVAVEWLKSTFLYIRVMKNPKHYGIDVGLTKDEVEKQLQDFCMKSLKSLSEAGMILLDDHDQFDVKPTENGRLMARYCVPFGTMKEFVQVSGSETLKEMMTLVSSCKSYDIQLRANEKRTLNTMNKDKNRITIRFPMEGKMKTSQMKVNCLLQAQLGCLPVQDFALAQDTIKIFRVGTRLARCLVEILWNMKQFKVLLNALLLSKAFKSRIWENSKYVSRQLDGIGPQISNALVNAGVVTLQKLEETNPREIEMIVNRHPPFGNNIRDNVASLPKYEVTVEQSPNYSSQSADLTISITIANTEAVTKKNTAGPNHSCALLIGDSDNMIVHKVRLSDGFLMKIGKWSKRLNIQRATKGDELSINYISYEWVGLDVQSSYTPFYSGGTRHQLSYSEQETNVNQCATMSKTPKQKTMQDGRRPCNHRCIDKAICGHDCCKLGAATQLQEKKAAATPSIKDKPELVKKPRVSAINSCLSEMKHRMDGVQATPRLKPGCGSITSTANLQDFAFTPQQKMPSVNSTPASKLPLSSLSPSGWEELDMYQQNRMFERDSSPNQRTFPEYPMGDPITDAMARTGFGNFESGYFDDIGDEAEMIEMADGANEPTWEDDYLPDLRMTTSNRQAIPSSSKQRMQSYVECQRMGRPVSNPRHHTAQWSSLSQLQTPNMPEKHLSYKANSWNTCGLNKASPISISDDDAEDDQLPEIHPQPKPRLGQVFAWSKSKVGTKQQGASPSEPEKKCEGLRRPQVTLNSASKTNLKRPSPIPSSSFTSAKKMFEESIEKRYPLSSCSRMTEDSKSPGFSASSDDDDLLANHLASQEQHIIAEERRQGHEHQYFPTDITEARSPVSCRKSLMKSNNVNRPKLSTADPVMPEPQKPYTGFFSSTFVAKSYDDSGLDDAENTFSTIFADIF